MIDARTYACAICGEANTNPTQWFLIMENRWEGKLKIFEWNSRLAVQHEIYLACSPLHVQELVVHWMATGSVNHPFAQTSPRLQYASPRNARSGAKLVVNTNGVRTIGELTVHRESICRILSENPASLRSVLDALNEVLLRHSPAIPHRSGISLATVARES